MIEVGQDLDKAIQLLRANELVAIPTETVYGLAGNALEEKAIRKIFQMKKRPLNNPLILHIHSLDQLATYCQNISPHAYKLAQAFWPGPLTLLLDKSHRVPDLVTAGSAQVAVRIPNHSMTLHLLQQLDFPLVAPSANPFTTISPTKAQHVVLYFADKLSYVLDGGDCQQGIESTIIGFKENQGQVYRLGSLAIEEIEKVIGPCVLLNKKAEQTLLPGMFHKHYSPRTPFILSSDIQQSIHINSDKKIGLLLFDQGMKEEVVVQKLLSPQGDLQEAATNLYATMHTLDSMGLDLIIAPYFPNLGIGKTINDRLKRASAK